MFLKLIARTIAFTFAITTGAVAQSEGDKVEALALLTSNAIYSDDWFNFVELARNPYLLMNADDVTYVVDNRTVPAHLAEQICQPGSYLDAQSALQAANITLASALDDLNCYYHLRGELVREPHGDIVQISHGRPLVLRGAFLGPLSLYQSWLINDAAIAFDFAKDVAREGRIELLPAILDGTSQHLPLPEFVQWLQADNTARFTSLGSNFIWFRSRSIYRANWAICRSIAGNLWRGDPGKVRRAAVELQSPSHVQHYNDYCVGQNWGWGFRSDMDEALGPVFGTLSDAASSTVGDREPWSAAQEAALLSQIESLVAAGATVGVVESNRRLSLVDQPIDIALRKSSFLISEYLLNQGATTDHRGMSGHDPLVTAILSGAPTEIIEKILDNGADLSRSVRIDASSWEAGEHCTSPAEKASSASLRFNALDFAFCHNVEDTMRLIVSQMDVEDVNCVRFGIARLWDLELGLNRDGIERIRNLRNDQSICG